MQSDYARSPQGQRAYCQRPHSNGEKSNLIAGLSSQGIQAPWLVRHGSVDGATFETYVRHILVATLIEGQIIILDNYSIHKSDAIKHLIEQAGCQLLFLPTYSPDFNPIELAFSKIKAFLKKNSPTSFEQLSQLLCKAFASITLQDILGWFRHSGYSTL